MVCRRIRRELLRGHVRRRADGKTRGRGPGRRERRTQRLGHAEIGDERVTPLRQHVARLDVAMHHAMRVRVGERIHDVGEDADDVLDRKPAALLEPHAQRLTAHEGHRVVEEIAVLPRGEERNDVRMLQLRSQVDLASEALAVDARGELGREDLHHHGSSQRLLGGQVDVAHAAAGELSLDRIGGRERSLEPLEEGIHGLNVPPAGRRNKLGQKDAPSRKRKASVLARPSG